MRITMASGFVFVLVLSVSLGMNQQVSTTCDVKNGIVNCASTGLTQVPRNSSVDQVRVLILSHNSLNTLGKNDFFDYSKLSIIFLDCNKINYIDDNSFNHLTTLTHLNLTNNKITSLSNTVFESNSRLKTLELSHNPLKQLNSTFINSTSILSLFINKCNITFVHENAFSGLTKLEILEIKFNYITILPGNFLNFSLRLSEVYLNGNPLDIVKSTVLSSKSLTYLDLSFCQLKNISSEFVTGLTQLKTLSLINNSLEHLPDGFVASIPTVDKLYLKSNPWHCGDYMEELLKTKRGFVADSKKINNCTKPDGEQQALLWNLTQTEMLSPTNSTATASQEDVKPTISSEDTTTAFVLSSTTSPYVTSTITTTTTTVSSKRSDLGSTDDHVTTVKDRYDVTSDIAIAILVFVILIFVVLVGFRVFDNCQEIKTFLLRPFNIHGQNVYDHGVHENRCNSGQADPIDNHKLGEAVPLDNRSREGVSQNNDSESDETFT